MDFNTLLAVKDLMAKDIVVSSKSETVLAIAKLMADKGTDSVVLTDENGELAGILTETEIVRNVVAGGLAPDKTKASKVMDSEVSKIEGSTSIFEARDKMKSLNVTHMIVEEDSKPIGLISATLLGS